MRTITCDVRFGPDTCALFDVETSDGRRFVRCAIHGSGGMLRGRNALRHARRRVEGHDGPRPRDYIDVYTRLTSEHRGMARIPIALVTRVDLHIG